MTASVAVPAVTNQVTPEPPPTPDADRTAVLIIDRGAVFRRGLADCLETDPEIEVVGSVGTANEGYRLAGALRPKVVVVGTSLPDAPGLEAAGELRRRWPDLATVVMADAESDEELFAAIHSSAAAYVGKDVAEDWFVATVKRTAAGEWVINEQLVARPLVAATIVAHVQATPTVPPTAGAAFAPLTDRELEVLAKVADGLTNAAIGDALGISQHTVKNHLTSILRKLALHRRTHAVTTALRQGWLDGGGYHR